MTKPYAPPPARSPSRAVNSVSQPCDAAGAGVDGRLTFDRSRYRPEYLSLGLTEAQVQRDILKALAQAGIFAHAFDAGGKAMRARAGAGGAGAGAAGLPDIVGVLPGGRALLIECKRPPMVVDGRQVKPAGKPSPAQLEYLSRAVDMGAAAGVAWSVGDALEIAGVGK